ncbi:alpha/beta hydrolase [Paraburkholderia bengalensis]|uniref:Alpha/beta hydrolase n=1 Tax=Paraburkholderia bengalensis TaxID=2747562 RepID=A0ABU8J480_9BURK
MKTPRAAMANADERRELMPIALEGILTVQARARAIVVFMSASSRIWCSPHDRRFAHAMERCGFATLLSDLLTESEHQSDSEMTTAHRTHIPMLVRRLEGTLAWWRGQPDVATLPVGLWGGGIQGAVAIGTCADIAEVRAIVSDAGRPDLVESVLLTSVSAPTLMTAVEGDDDMTRLSRNATEKMICAHRIQSLPNEPCYSASSERPVVPWFESWLNAEPLQHEVFEE